jgi:tetratricopeptide (TPR) repeat protein
MPAPTADEFWDVGPMGILRTSSAYDRTRILDQAGRARAKKRRRQAIELYRWVLAIEPGNAALHAKLAPLLAETGQTFDAWISFRKAARACLQAGEPEKAVSVYREAARLLPREVAVWQALAALHKKRKQPREAIEALLEGSRHFRSRWLRPQAIHLLRRANDIEPWNFEAVYELARLLSATGQPHEAGLLLGGLARRSGGDRLRRVRGAQLRLAPGPRAAWRWLQAALRPEPEPEEPPAPRRTAGVVPLRSQSRRIQPR